MAKANTTKIIIMKTMKKKMKMKVIMKMMKVMIKTLPNNVHLL